jgi:hypothetical protein
MDYYIDPNRTATFTLLDVRKQSPRPEGRPSGRKLAAVNVTAKDIQQPTLTNIPAGVPLHYPAYAIVTVREIVEVIEHRRMEPIFYITDDPAVLSELVSGAH